MNPNDMTLDQCRDVGGQLPTDAVPVAGHPEYRISKDGRVWTSKITGGNGRAGVGWRTLAPQKVKGYTCVCVSSGGKERMLRVHRALLESFVGPSNGLLACHNDGNPSNNDLANLRWDTPKANAQDMVRHGTMKVRRGEDCPTAKLTDEVANAIRVLLSQGESRSHISRMFNVNKQTVCNIANGVAWNTPGAVDVQIPKLTTQMLVFLTDEEANAVRAVAEQNNQSTERVIRDAILSRLAVAVRMAAKEQA